MTKPNIKFMFEHVCWATEAGSSSRQVSRLQLACEGLLQPERRLNAQLTKLHQATSSSGNSILPGSPQRITPDTCLNHINPDSQRKDASSTQGQKKTTSEIPAMCYCSSDTASSTGMGWSGVFHLYVRAGKDWVFCWSEGFFFLKNRNTSSHADSWLTEAWLNLCFAHILACVCVHASISPRPSISGSLPLPCPLKTSNVFFAQLCAGLCVQACVAFPLSCIQSQQQPHTHAHTQLPCSLGSSVDSLVAAVFCCCEQVELANIWSVCLHISDPTDYTGRLRRLCLYWCPSSTIYGNI